MEEKECFRGKEKDTRAKECTKEKEKERAKEQAKEKEKE